MSNLRKNITFNLFGQGVVIILGFVSFKYIYAGLGEDALGIIYFSLMLSTLFASALDMGLSKTTVREVAINNDSEPGYIIKLTQTFSLLYWLAYIVVAILFVILLPVILDSWINLTTMDGELAYQALLIIGVTSLLAIPKAFMASICDGLQRMDIKNSVDVGVSILQQLGIIILLLKGNNLLSVAYLIGATNILRVLIYYLFITKLLSFSAMCPLFSMKVIRRIKDYTKRIMWISLVLVVHKQLDKVLLSKLLPIGLLGIYSFIFNSIAKTSLITSSVSQAVFPFFSELEKKGEREKIIGKFNTLQDFLVFGTAPLFVFVAFFAIPIFTFLLDETKALELQLPILLLSLSFYLSAVIRLVRIFMLAISKPEPIIRADVLSLFIVIPSTTILVYNMGINGAALAWVIFYCSIAIFIVPAVYKKEFNKSPFIWLKSVLLAFILMCLTYIPAWLLAEAYFPKDLFFLLMIYAVASSIYGVLALNMVGKGMKEVVLRHLPRVEFLIFSVSRG